MPYNTRSQKQRQGTGDESSCAIGKQQQTPEMAGTTGSRKRQKVMEHKQSRAISKQPKAPRTPDYTPPCSPMYVPTSPCYSPTYAPAYSPPKHRQLCMVGGVPVTTVALSVWDGDRSSGKHTCTPKSPPCSPTYAPAYSPPDHTQLLMVNGMPVTTVALSVWDGDPSSSKHKCTPKSPPCSPKYAPTRVQQPGSGTRCGTPTYALEPV